MSAGGLKQYLRSFWNGEAGQAAPPSGAEPEQDKPLLMPVEISYEWRSSREHIVNITRLEAFTEGDCRIERDLFGLFLQQAETALERLEGACEGEESETWRDAAYKLRGVADNLGAERLAALCHVAEKGFAQSPLTRRAYLAALQASYRDVRKYLRERLERLEAVAQAERVLQI